MVSLRDPALPGVDEPLVSSFLNLGQPQLTSFSTGKWVKMPTG